MKRLPTILTLLVISTLSPLCWRNGAMCVSVDRIIQSSAGVEIAGSILKLAPDTHFVAMDLADVQLGPMDGNKEGSTLLRLSRGVEPSPFILWRNDVTHESGVWIMTLDPQSGAQMGSRLGVDFLKSWYPVDVLWTQHFVAPLERGIEPSPWIVFRDYRLYTFPVSYNADGTPVAGMPETFLPAVDSLVYGHAACAAELPGSEFADGRARLFVGTDMGYIVVLAIAPFGGIGITEILSVSSVPIVSLQPIPQCDYIALGVLTGNVVKGIHYQPGLSQLSRSNSFTVIFTLLDPRRPTLQDLDSFGPDDTVLPDCQSTLGLVLANGTTDLALASIEADQTGTATLTLTLDPHEVGIKSAVTGSLLMLASNELAVTFDPYYSQQSGSSGCDLNVTDAIADQCEYICGDADGNSIVNISDAVYLINYIFSGGPAPNPLLAGDCDCNGIVNISDAVYLINYIFSGGAAPCAACK